MKPMTAETDLLPLPEPAFRLKWRDGAYYVSEPSIGNTDCYTAEQVRACVSSATEALRRDRDDCLAAREHYAGLYGEQLGRAERLAEALRWYANPEVYKPHPHGPAFDRRDLSFVARAALDQETTNG